MDRSRRTSLILAIVCFTVAALALGGLIQTANAEPQKIIGKATVPAGTELLALVVIQDSLHPIKLIAFDKQVLYVLKRITKDDDGNLMEPGYIIDGDGFRHNCPTHGLEVMSNAIIALPDSRLKEKGITIELF